MSKNDPAGTPARSREEALADFKRSLTDELDKIFDEATIAAAKEKKTQKKAPKEEPRVEVSNFGRVGSILLPPGWVERQPEPDEANPKRKLREFHPQESTDVKMCLFFRGHKVAEENASAFKTLLEKPPHFLTPTELKSVAEIVRDKADKTVFKVIVIATRDVNGLPVLVTEGRYLETNQDVYAIHADADGSGSIVQEVIYQGPKEDYLRFFSEALGAIKSIQWKPS